MAIKDGSVQSTSDNFLEDVQVDSPELNSLVDELSGAGFLDIRTLPNSSYLTLENLVRQIDAAPLISLPDEKAAEATLVEYQSFFKGLDKSGFFPILYTELQERNSEGTILRDRNDKPIERKYVTIAMSETGARISSSERVRRDAHTIVTFEDHVLPYLKGRIDARIRKLDDFSKVQQEISEIDKRLSEKQKLMQIKNVLQLDGAEFLLLPDLAYDRLVNLSSNLENRRKYLKGIKDDTSAAEMFYAMVGQSLDVNASDIHLEPLQERARIRFRVDGILHEVARIPDDRHKALINYLKNKSVTVMPLEQNRKPQDGAIFFGRRRYIDENEEKGKKDAQQIRQTQEERELELKRDEKFNGYSLRLATMPVTNGVKMAMRVQKPNRGYNLRDLGYPEDVYRQIQEQMHAPHGIVLVNGPTSSGKSTTIYAMLSELNKEGINIVSAEDPVECEFDGMNQSNMNPAIGWTFSAAIRSFMRQDPNVIFVGEMRDLETAQAAMEAAKTGHTVFSTLHTNDSILALLRLQSLGVSGDNLESCLRASVAQRLVRVLCPECKQQYDATSDLNELFKKDNLFHAPISTFIDYNSSELGRGKKNNCGHCNGYGFKGRTVISEIWVPGKEEKQLIYSGKGSYEQYLAIAYKNGMKPLASAGLDLLLDGRTTIPELSYWIDRQDFINKADILVPTVRGHLKTVN